MKSLVKFTSSLLLFVACGQGPVSISPEPPPPPDPCPPCETPAPPLEPFEVEKSKPIPEARPPEPAHINNLGTKALQNLYFVPECKAMSEGNHADFQFNGNYLARWTNYRATLSAENIDLENQFLRLKFETNYFGRIGINLANEGKTSLETNYHVMPTVVCTEYPVMCLQRLDEIEDTIQQIRERSTTPLTEYQIAMLNCLQNFVATLRQVIQKNEDS